MRFDLDPLRRWLFPLQWKTKPIIYLLLLLLLLVGCRAEQKELSFPALSPLAPTGTLSVGGDSTVVSPYSTSEISSIPFITSGPPNQYLSPGEIFGFQDTYGTYFLYRPTNISDLPKTLVVIHGTPAKDLSAEETAFYYAQHWAPFAEEQGWLLLVPAFNQADFSSRKGEITDALTGYRGLFGREIGADDWVIRLLGLGWEALGWQEAPFYLYGHSAGGQYVGRFLVTHPELVERAVISAAVTYPQPDPALSWPYGMGALSSEIIWEDGTIAQVEVIPEVKKWLAATQVLVKVIVGLDDLEPQLSRPGQNGRVRLAIGQNWVEAMGVFAAENDLESRITFGAISGKGHSMLGLLPFCQAALTPE